MAHRRRFRQLPWLIFIVGFLYAAFMSQGVPLWDDDFTSWFWKIKDHGIFYYLAQLLSPISTQPQYWGFNERPVEAILYKLFFAISGYESWSYFLYRDLVYGALGVMIYWWGLRLAPDERSGKWAAFSGAMFFLFAPNPLAAHIMHQDLAGTSELILLVLSYWIWSEVEKTPRNWVSLKISDSKVQKWLKIWALIVFATFLGYKSKADVKTLPLILALYVAATRRTQWRVFAFPVALMAILAVPWGPGVFSKLPPFFPGSHGSEVVWMWQPASWHRLREFIWSSAPYNVIGNLKSPTISLAGLLGPFLLTGILSFLAWRVEALDRIQWTTQATAQDRARSFVLIWWVVLLVAVSSLPEINYTFRIRYGILTLVPTSILLIWFFGLFADSLRRMPSWILPVGLALLAAQIGINLVRTVEFRNELGLVMNAVDQVYSYVNAQYPNRKLVLLPDFRSYDYRPDSAPVIQGRERLAKTDELAQGRFKPMETYAISWQASLWEQLEVVHLFSGCRDSVFYDRIFRCSPGVGAFLMRYIGNDPLYQEGEALRAKGELARAQWTHERFLEKHPGSLAARFVIGLEAFQQKNWELARSQFSYVEALMPYHPSLIYNHAVSLVELKRYNEAITELTLLLDRRPNHYSGLLSLFSVYKSLGKRSEAQATLLKLQRLFPNEAEVKKLSLT